jgi:cytochrome b561
MPSTPAAYSTATAIACTGCWRWLMFGSFGMGLYMTGLPMSPTRLKLYNWHKWAGVTILVLSFLRLAWRLTHRPPADVAMPAWQARAAHAAHIALYVLFFAVPLAGWAYSSAAGFPIVWFGVLPLPDLVPAQPRAGRGHQAGARDPGLQHGRDRARARGRRTQAPARRPRRAAAAHVARAAPDSPSPPPTPPLFTMSATTRFTLTLAVALLSAARLVAAWAQAKPPAAAQLQAAGSEIAFVTRQMGVPVEGKFGKFSAQIALDPKKPEPAAWPSPSTPAAPASALPRPTPRCPSPCG